MSTEAERTSSVPETIATYLRLRGLAPTARVARRRRRRTDDENEPFTAGRDPKGVADILTDLTREAGWDAQLAREDVVLTWNEVAGAETARHTSGSTGAASRTSVRATACTRPKTCTS